MENLLWNILVEWQKVCNFAVQKGVKPMLGLMSEWLGTGLQNRLHQFESG